MNRRDQRQIDLGPEGYRKREPMTGRWLQNVDKRLCRVMSGVGLATTAIFVFAAYRDGTAEAIPSIIAACILGFASGAAFTLSLKSIDW